MSARKGAPYVRVWFLFYMIEGQWQRDGEWWLDRAGARCQAKCNGTDFQWKTRIVPLDVPADVFDGAAFRRVGI